MIRKIKDNFNGLDIVVNNALNHYTFNPKTRKPISQLRGKTIKISWTVMFTAASMFAMRPYQL